MQTLITKMTRNPRGAMRCRAYHGRPAFMGNGVHDRAGGTWRVLRGTFVAVVTMVLGLVVSVVNSQAGTQTYNSAGTYSWTAPAGVTSVTVEAWGGGGAGGERSSNGVGGGGGGGAYARSTVAITPGNSYQVVVGAAGVSGASPTNGGNSTFNTTTVLAEGGKSVPQNSATGGSGGLAANSTGTVKYNGGNGYTTPGTNGGGGGSSAGTGSAGTSASGSAGAAAVSGGGPGGAGATSNNSSGSAPASGPGGGGGGGRRDWTGTQSGGAGWAGSVVLTWVDCSPAGSITIDAGQSVNGNPYSASSLISSQSGVNTIEYKATKTTTIPDSNSNWGRTTAGGTETGVVWTRAMSGNAPATANMKLKSVSIYVGSTHTEQVRLAVYSGGNLSTGPAGATLLHDFGPTTGSLVNQWLTLTYSGADIIVPANQPVWIAFKADGGGFSTAYDASSAGTNFQAANGRWNSGAVSSDETTGYPASWPADGGGSFGAFWYSMYITYASGGGPSTTTCTDWTSTANIPATTATGSACGDYTDGGTYGIQIRGIDNTCSSTVLSTPSSRDFTWNACTDTDLATLAITAPAGGATIGGSYTFKTQVGVETNPQNMTNVQFFINGAWKNAAWNSSTSRWEYTSVTSTDYAGSGAAPVDDTTLRVRGNDPDCSNPTITSSPDLSITVDNTDSDPATLTTVNPANGSTVSGMVTVQVQVGVESAPATMTSMQVSIPAGTGGTAVSNAAMNWNGSSSRWEYSWNTTATHPQTGVVSSGVTINVRGNDPDNGSTVNATQITVTVDNRTNATTAGTATAVAASATSIAVSMPYTHDKNANNTYTVAYKLTSAGSYTTWVANAANTASPYATTITGLTQLSSYDVRVTYNDVDGVSGSPIQDFTLSTPALDSGAPDPITITSATTEIGAGFLRISWTATGDDPGDLAGSGKSATSYDLRYAKRPIVESGATATQTNWAAATAVVGEPTPKVKGAAEFFDVTGLQSNTTYYFAIKATDDVGNVSAISNSPAGKTGLLKGWNMVSSPLTLVTNDTMSVFGDDAGNDWMYSWTPTGAATPDSNGFWTKVTTVVRDQGLLIYSKKSNDPTDAPGNATVNGAASTNIALSAGYNLIGAPYNGIVTLSSCEVSNGGAFVSFAQGVTNGWVDNSIWTWNGSSYVATAYNAATPATMDPWKGYWLLSLQNGITLKVYKPAGL